MHRLACLLLGIVLIGLIASCSGSEGPEVVVRESTATPAVVDATAMPSSTEPQPEQIEPPAATSTEITATATATQPATATSTATAPSPTATEQPSPTAIEVPPKSPQTESDSRSAEVREISSAIRDWVSSDANPDDAQGADDFQLRMAFHLHVANVGEYYSSSIGYDAWLDGFLFHARQPYGTQDEYSDLDNHVLRQVYVALTQPDSNIARFVRDVALNLGSGDPSAGVVSIYAMLVVPAIYPPTGYFNPGAARAIELKYQSMAQDYLQSGSSTDFAAYLNAAGFAENFNLQALNDPLPSATPVSPSTNIPSTGALIYDRPLSEWRELQYDYGWMEPTPDSLLVGIYAYASQGVIEAWTNRSDFADISASVQVRNVSGDDDAAGCLAIRHDADSGDYSFCMLADGRTLATYSYIDSNGTWQDEVLLSADPRPDTRPVELWNTLEIRAKGNQFWVLINGTVVGSGTHNGRSSGDVAIIVTNRDSDQYAEFEFKDLVVRELE